MTFSPDEVRVDPVASAVPVNYPWSDATAAVEALDAARSRLETELEGRPSLFERITEWRGGHRDEFDETYDGISTTAGGVVELLQSVATAIANGAEDAGNQQLANNNAAEEAAADAAAAEAAGALPMPGDPAIGGAAAHTGGPFG